MAFRKIHLLAEVDFLACTVATTVLRSNERVLRDIATKVVENGFDWCMSNNDPEKDDAWWKRVRDIHDEFD